MRRLVMLSVLLSACVTGPHNGTVVDSGPVVGKKLTYQGYTDHPNEKVVLQVLKKPDLDPTVDGNWAQFASTFTSTQPSYYNDPDEESPLYYWSTVSAPVPTAADAGRWPVGGLVRTRARRIDADGEIQQLPTFDDVTISECLAQHSGQSWGSLTDCFGMGTGNTVVAQAANLTKDLPAAKVPDYLGRKEVGLNAAGTLAYYLKWGAPSSLAAFKQSFGFGGAGEVTATYYNDNDLGLGREMHCTSSPGVVACYVSNYSGNPGVADFSKSADAALDDAVHRTGKFATVAMVWRAAPPDGVSKVNFVVYDASGNQVFTAKLDSTGKHTAIPTNCIECHGISSYYNTSTASFGGEPQFLPFDLATFKYSTAAGFTQAAQADAFRRLNAMVKQTAPTPAITQLINGMYAPKAVTDPTAVWNDDYVPNGWQSNLHDIGTYKGVIKKGCRTCHMSGIGSIDFLEEDDWALSGRAAVIRGDVCGAAHDMPQAERVAKNFWASGGRAYLITGWQVSPNDHLQGCAPQ